MSIYLLIAVLFWGFSYIAIKASLEYLSPVEMIAARFILGGATLFIIIKAKRLSMSFKGQLKTIIFSALILFLHFWIMATGMIYTSAINTAWILTTAPIFIALLSFIVLKERFGKFQIIGAVLATIGILVMVSKGDLGSLGWLNSIGDWIVLGSCLSWAVYTIVTRKVAKKINPLVLTFWMIFFSGLVIVPYSFLRSGFDIYMEMPWAGILSIVFLGVGSLAISFWAWSEGLARKPAGEVGIYLYIEPLFAMLGAYMLLDENITISLIFGAALILYAVYISERKRFKPGLSSHD